MYSIDRGRMLIREGAASVLLTYLKNVSEDTASGEDSAARHHTVKKESWREEEALVGGTPMYGVYGEVLLDGSTYLIYVKESRRAGSINGAGVYEVLSGGCICLSGRDDPAVHSLVGEFFRRQGLFFSEEDLSRAGSAEKKRDNSDFIFNYIPLSRYLQRESSGESSGFSIKVVQGHFSSCTLAWTCAITCTIISRRSWRMAGTRYFSRGSDSNGHAANTVETLFVVETSGGAHFYLQCRGSIPLSWEQRINLSYKPPVTMGSSSTSASLFSKHMRVLSRRYASGTVFVSLLDTAGHEKELGEAFVEQLKRSREEYYAVDYHKMIKNEGEKRAFKQALKEIVLKNKTIRTNCIDCLDRTNVVQAQIAKIKMLEYLDLPEYSSSGSVLDMDDYLAPSEKKKLGALWNSNANALSLQYTGTSALKNDLTSLGVRTIRGIIQDAISSGKRYVNNNFLDGKMQEVIEIVTGVRHSLGNSSRGERKKSSLGCARIGCVLLVLSALAYSVFGWIISLLVLLVLIRIVLYRRLSFPSSR